MSGRVRDAFRRRGHEAFSCDIERSDAGEFPEFHIQGDVLELLSDQWDLGVFFPPCTYLTNAGNTHYRSRRQAPQDAAIAFVESLWECPIPRIAIENPIGVLSTRFRRPDQYIQPYWYGDPYIKKTCLWLKNLPLLVPDKDKWCRAESRPWVSTGRDKAYIGRPGVRDQKRRSLTFNGIAEAMAEQWGTVTTADTGKSLSIDGYVDIALTTGISMENFLEKTLDTTRRRVYDRTISSIEGSTGNGSHAREHRKGHSSRKHRPGKPAHVESTKPRDIRCNSLTTPHQPMGRKGAGKVKIRTYAEWLKEMREHAFQLALNEVITQEQYEDILDNILKDEGDEK